MVTFTAWLTWEQNPGAPGSWPTAAIVPQRGFHKFRHLARQNLRDEMFGAVASAEAEVPTVAMPADEISADAPQGDSLAFSSVFFVIDGEFLGFVVKDSGSGFEVGSGAGEGSIIRIDNGIIAKLRSNHVVLHPDIFLVVAAVT